MWIGVCVYPEISREPWELVAGTPTGDVGAGKAGGRSSAARIISTKGEPPRLSSRPVAHAAPGECLSSTAPGKRDE